MSQIVSSGPSFSKILLGLTDLTTPNQQRSMLARLRQSIKPKSLAWL